MRALRLFVLASLLATVYIIGRYNVGHLLPNTGPKGVWTEGAAAAAASGYSPEEQNNIDIYKGAREATRRSNTESGSVQTSVPSE